MNVLVYKTNVHTRHQLNYIQSVLKRFKDIKQWSIDMQDIDKVLRIVISNGVSEVEILNAVKSIGINCEELNS